MASFRKKRLAVNGLDIVYLTAGDGPLIWMRSHGPSARWSWARVKCS